MAKKIALVVAAFCASLLIGVNALLFRPASMGAAPLLPGLLASIPLPTGPPSAVTPASPASPAASCTNLANWQCVETRAGLALCRANNICVIKVDLNNTSIRPRVVIAPGGGTDWLSSMASNAGALAAINGDYFSGCPDPNPPYNCGQGLTYVDGVDYTNYDYANWQNRRSLGFNDNYDPNIGWPSEQGSYHRYLLGGGPQVTFGGEYRWRCWYQGYNTDGNCECRNANGNWTVVINDELFGCSANNWWNRPQTFIAFSDDRNTLYLAVSEPGYTRTPHEMHDVLWVHGARYSLKMDGGGSSGMYFNDGGYQFTWNGSRQVANAWVIVPNTTPPPTPPPSCNPNADQVALYANTNYGGSCVVLNIGDYPNPGYLSPVGNDDVESIRVGGNVQAVLCEHDNYQGTCETFTGDDASLGDNSIGANRVSSVKVQQRSQPPSQPDLRPYAPPGYSYPVVPSSILGTHEPASLYAGKPTYFDWHFTNSGNATAANSFYVELWIDTIRYVRYPHSDFGAGWVGGFDDWNETIPTSGWHTVRLITDPDNAIAESDETNNVWESLFYWNLVTGWWGEYYNSEDLSGSPALVRDDAGVDFIWGYDSPGPGISADQFSVRWTRSLYFAGGVYEFSVTHDDGARLWVDGGLAIDQWGTCCQTDTASVPLAAGIHSIRVEMFEHYGAAIAQLSWKNVSHLVYLPLIVKMP